MTKCKAGYKEFYGKCSKKMGILNVFSGRSYNLFKLWGSWTGAIVSLVYFLFSTKYAWFDARDILLFIFGSLDQQTGGFIFGTILTLVIGFLIGGIIHILIRRYFKK